MQKRALIQKNCLSSLKANTLSGPLRSFNNLSYPHCWVLENARNELNNIYIIFTCIFLSTQHKPNKNIKRLNDY